MSFFLSLLTIFTVLGFWNVQRVSAADVTDKAKFENLKITIASTGDESTGYHGENDTTVALKYSGEFSFPNVTANEIKEGDFFIVEAPSNLSLEDRTLKLEDKISGKTIGNVRVESAKHRLVFTFNSEVEDKQNIRGDFFASAKETVTKEDKIVTYVLPGGKTQIITFKTLKTQQAPVEGEVIYKGGWNHGSLAKAGYYVRINRSQQDLKNKTIEITDDISLGAFASYIDGSFALNEAEFDTTNTNFANLKRKIKPYKVTTDPEEYKKDSDNTALLTLTNGKRSFKLLMPTNMGKKSFFLEYATTSPADTSEIKNSAQFLIDNEPQLTWKKWGDKINTSKESVVTLKTVKAAGASVTADIAGKIKITKFDEADADVKLAGVVFEIFEKGTNKLVDTVTTDKDGIALSKALNDGKYIVKEKTPKSGYQVNSQEFEVEMKGGKGVPLNISNKRVTVDFEATKTWVGGKKTDYKEVKLGLYVHKKGQTVADSKPVSGNYTPEVTESNGVYTYKWKNQLPKYDVDGTTELVYSVRELQDQTNLPLADTETVVGGTSDYVVSYNADKTQVTNTYEVPKTKVTAKKVWSGGKADARPKFYFKLYRTLEGGTEEAVANAEKKEVPKTDGTVEWTNLPATDANAKKYTYSVKEVDAQEKPVTTVGGYTANQTDATTVTNTYKLLPTKTDIFVDKELTGNRPTPLQADEFEFILKDEKGTEVQRAKNDANGHVVFKDIPFDKEGQYKFTIVEAHAGQTINGVTHDSRSVGVTVSVYDPGQGKLVATPLYDQISTLTVPFANFATSDSSLPPGAISVIDNGGIQKFVNTYKAEKAKMRLGVKKTLTGRELKADEFEFTLTDKDGNVKETVKNDKEGNVKFSELTFATAGIYTYKIAEKVGNIPGVTYDTKTITATITVTDNGKGTLESTVVYDDEKPFTNKYTPAPATKVKIAGKKVLEGKTLEAGKYNFALKKTDGSVVQTVTNDVDGNFAFDELTYDENQVGTHKYTISEVEGTETGVTYDKTVREVEVKVEKISATELKATVSKEAKDLVFTNKYTPAPATKVKIAGKKVLEGKTLEAGKYNFALKKTDGSVVQTVTNDVDGNFAFDELTYDENQVGTHKYTISEVEGTETGVTYDKTVREVEVKVEKISATELKATVSKEAKDLVFTNKYTPAKMQIPVKKIWDDVDNQDGKRPTKITVKLLADGQDTDKTLELSEANGWAGNFTDLDADKGGAPIDYKVVEVSSVAGYTTEISGDAKTGFTITNKYTPETIDIKATKNWDDANNQDGKRPKYITVNLLADGEKVASKEVKAAADGTWSTVFTKLPKFKAGKVIKYSLTEEVVSEYTSEINDFNITNKYTPKLIDYQVTKTWNDNNNQDGKRPDHITVHLMKTVGGVTTEVEKYDIKVAEADPANGNVWKHTFSNLPKYEAGQEIVYSVKEDAVAGYETSIKGQEITNTHTPETIVISGKKVWEDNNNQDGKRTATVKVQILKGKEIVDEIETSEEKGWAFESKPLPKYENGQEIKYEVKEITKIEG
ncbi:Cna B-type domain-containing protein [Streptococcus anginosus]|nr:Cna B-type domain-containing protein [Streptococcus anginosus]